MVGEIFDLAAGNDDAVDVQLTCRVLEIWN